MYIGWLLVLKQMKVQSRYADKICSLFKQKDDYFKTLSLNMDNSEIEMEFLKYESWKDKTQIRATPTVLVNGYQLPESYKIGDLFGEQNLKQPQLTLEKE
jgi:hypothetical protein